MKHINGLKLLVLCPLYLAIVSCTRSYDMVVVNNFKKKVKLYSKFNSDEGIVTKYLFSLDGNTSKVVRDSHLAIRPSQTILAIGEKNNLLESVNGSGHSANNCISEHTWILVIGSGMR